MKAHRKQSPGIRASAFPPWKCRPGPCTFAWSLPCSRKVSLALG